MTSMSQMFRSATSFNADISAWDTSSVTNMGNMFMGHVVQCGHLCVGHELRHEHGGHVSGATSFNANISAWDTSSVTSMGNMFYGATAFNADISAWDVSSVTSMGDMFDRGQRSMQTSLHGTRALSRTCTTCSIRRQRSARTSLRGTPAL